MKFRGNSMRTNATLLAAGAVAVFTTLPLSGAGAQASGDWPTYLDNGSRTGFNAAETAITPSTVSGLKLLWTDTSGPVSAQPVVAGGVVYYGSWDGYERAVNASTGSQIWSTFIGQTNDSHCSPPTVGVASTATVTTTTINGTPTQVVYVGGGDAAVYALNAATGAVIWRTPLGTSPSTFMWGSPLVANGSVYEGIASFGDCPLVRGGVAQLDPATGAIQNTLWTGPASCTGATVWSSPSVDPATGDLYFATGNSTKVCTTGTQYPDTFIQTDANLNMLGNWQVPAASQVVDGDFGTSPTLFTAVIGGVQHQLVGLPNKNGIFYAFDRANISAGPIWHRQLGFKGNCPECGKGDIAPAAYDGSHLFAGATKGSTAGVTCAGFVRELKPVSGGVVWLDCLQTGPVLGAISMVPGVVFADAGNTVYALAASNGATLWSYQDTSTGSDFWGSASISNGVLYVGNMDGNLYAFGI